MGNRSQLQSVERGNFCERLYLFFSIPLFFFPFSIWLCYIANTALPNTWYLCTHGAAVVVIVVFAFQVKLFILQPMRGVVATEAILSHSIRFPFCEPTAGIFAVLACASVLCVCVLRPQSYISNAFALRDSMNTIYEGTSHKHFSAKQVFLRPSLCFFLFFCFFLFSSFFFRVLFFSEKQIEI